MRDPYSGWRRLPTGSGDSLWSAEETWYRWMGRRTFKEGVYLCEGELVETRTSWNEVNFKAKLTHNSLCC